MRPRTRLEAAVTIGMLASGLSLTAQQPAAATASASGEAEIVPVLRRISQHSSRLLPLLEQVRPQDWIARGAPDTYVAQLASAQGQVGGIAGDMAALAQHPEKMQDCMRALFRIHAFHSRLESVLSGLRKYQNPALADLIQSVSLEDQQDVGKLQEYSLDLANQKEQEYLVVDHEAQRCRASLSRQPGPVRKSK